MTKLIFACGAYLEAGAPDAAEKYPAGKRLMTFVNDKKVNVQRPRIPDESIKAEGLKPGSRVNCLILCPCTVKQSGRKIGRGWFGEGNSCAGEPTLHVSCKVRAHG